MSDQIVLDAEQWQTLVTGLLSDGAIASSGNAVLGEPGRFSEDDLACIQFRLADDAGSLLRFGRVLADVLATEEVLGEQDYNEWIERARTDDMYDDIVLYFPGISLEEIPVAADQDSDEDEEEEE